MDFAKLKGMSDLDRLAKEIDKLNSPSERVEDTRFWKPERDKAGNASATIRFLPTPAVDGDEGLPWVRIWDHGFKGPSGRWYIEKSLTTLNKPDPVAEYNRVLWNSTNDDDSPARKQVRNQKRRLKYVSNILLLQDSKKNSPDEGKVFLFQYGKKIFDKIIAKMKPEFEGDDAVDVFHLYKGCNFKLRMRLASSGFPNYDESVFSEPSKIDMNDKELEALWKSEYSLKELITPDKFKSYDELKAKLESVLELNTSTKTSIGGKSAPKLDEESGDESPPWNDDENEDEDLKQFRQLLK